METMEKDPWSVTVSLDKRETKACPMCGEEIPKDSVQCGVCNEVLSRPGAPKGASPDPGQAPYVPAHWMLRLGSQAADMFVAMLCLLIPIVGLIPYLLYPLLKDGIGNGRSYGKRANKLLVIDATTGRPCTVGQSFLRNIMWWIPLVNLVEMVLVVSSGIRLGDRIAGTRVVRPSNAPPPGWVANALVFVCLGMIPVMGILAAIAIPNFAAARERANTRACFANQKTISGATEMYRLDKGLQADVDFSPAFLQTLVKEGYLMSLPTDPGQGPGTTTNYYQSGPSVISCRHHGNYRDPSPPKNR